MTLDLSTEELSTLMNLLDVATKAGGLQVAQAALPIAVKVQTALNAAKQPEPENTDG